ncbi:MAG: hypothetical protein DRN24_01155 [Thermoplasmata archaeon]|nr:MAG: hypothetical protein DRN24_01155 [Thermoplasmata archaeon]
MNKKIICFLVGTLLMFTFSVSATNVNIKNPSKTLTTNNNDEAELPTWHVDDSWTYLIEQKMIFTPSEDMIFYLTIIEVKFTVVHVGCDSYTLEFEGKAMVKFDHDSHVINLKKCLIRGTEEVERGTLGVKEVNMEIIPTVEPGLKAEINMSFEPAFTFIEFPLFVGKEWSYPSSTVTVDIHLPDDTSYTYHVVIPGGSASCTSSETISVKAGTYDAFKVEVHNGKLTIFYAPVVSNIVLLNGKIPAVTPSVPDQWFDFISIYCELLDTTYSVPGAPVKPNTPSGPTTGETGKIYTYCSISIDLEGDKIQYGWDWDGDYSIDEWTSFYNSGETVCMNHSWNEEGNYSVRVKAKDENGIESVWSDPLMVTISTGGNQPPSPPVIAGETHGKTGEEYDYTFTISDPDGDNLIALEIDFGDGNVIEPTPPASGWSSGSTVTVTHKWTTKGSYIIKARVKDEKGIWSEYGTLSVTMPRTRTVLFFENILKYYFPQLIWLLRFNDNTG